MAESERAARERRGALDETRRLACYDYLRDPDVFKEFARAVEEDAEGGEESAIKAMFKQFTDAWTTLGSAPTANRRPTYYCRQTAHHRFTRRHGE